MEMQVPVLPSDVTALCVMLRAEVMMHKVTALFGDLRALKEKLVNALGMAWGPGRERFRMLCCSNHSISPYLPLSARILFLGPTLL